MNGVIDQVAEGDMLKFAGVTKQAPPLRLLGEGIRYWPVLFWMVYPPLEHLLTVSCIPLEAVPKQAQLAQTLVDPALFKYRGDEKMLPV